jgi:hypothetical protein
MTKKTFFRDFDLAALAKKTRKAAGKRNIDVAREFKVTPSAVCHAEERPKANFLKLRIRMIETYSKYKVVGPVYYLKRK